jgi:signal transduction histidine kinase
VSELADRRRFERALHDGVQQDLIAIAVRLQLARQLLATDAAAAAGELEELEREVHSAIESVRALAADIYPPTLDARGLGEALRALPHVRVHAVGRHSAELEAAVFFCCVDGDAEIDVYDADGGVRLEVRGSVSPRFRALAEAAGASFSEAAR